MPGLYDNTLGLSDGTGLWRGRLGLFSGASGFINGSGGAYVDLYFSAGTYSVAGNGYTTLGSIPGFTFTRASLAMGYDATGKLTYGPNNLCTQSQTFDNAAWSKSQVTVTADASTAPDGTATADLLLEDTATGAHQLTKSVTNSAGSGAVFSVYAKPAGRSWIALAIVNAAGTLRLTYFNISTGSVGTLGAGVTAAITSAGSGWYRCSVSLSPAFDGSITHRVYLCSADGVTSYTGDGVSGAYIWGYQAEAVTYQTTPSTYYPTTTAAYYGPRLVYDPVTLASQGILVEEARTNSVVQSQDFSTSWTLSRATVSVNATTSPAGTSNADKLVEDATAANTHRAVGAVTTTAVPWTFSVYAKADTRTWIYLRVDRSDTTTPFTWFNLGAGAVGTVGTGITASIRSVGNGWYRCVVTVDAALAAPSQPIIGLSTGDGVSSYSGDGTSGLYVWQAQYELGTGASSPIPTTTASVTRAADVVNFTGFSAPVPYSVVSEFNPARLGAGVDIVNWGASLVSGGGQYIASASGYVWVRESNVTTAITNSGTITAAITNKVAGRYAVNDVNVSTNGAAVGTADTSVTPPTLANLGLSNSVYGFGGINLNGTISRIRIYNRALSDAELQAITQSLLLQEDGYSILQEDNSYIWLE